MSACEVYAITKTGNVRYFGEARNAFGGAFSVWRALIGKYLVRGDDEATIFMMRGDMGSLWRLVRDERLTRAERIVLASTYDNVVIWHDHLMRVIHAFEGWAHVHPKHTSHTMEEEVGLLAKIWQRKSLRGACFNQTSVCDSPWTVYGPHGGTRPYNVLRDSGHWELFGHYPELLEGAI